MSQLTQIVMQPMQWSPVPDVHDVEPLSDRDSECLSEIRNVLIRHNSIDRFAISLVHKHFDLAPAEQMVEFTDIEARTLTIKPIPESQGLNTLETTWKFSKESTAAQPLTVCVYRCFFNRDSIPQHAGQHTAG
jgi:hypothetical protein